MSVAAVSLFISDDKKNNKKKHTEHFLPFRIVSAFAAPFRLNGASDDYCCTDTGLLKMAVDPPPP